MKDDINFKKYRINYPPHGAWDDDVEPYVEAIFCMLYASKAKECRYPAKKCKNCSIYNGFKGNGRLKE